MQFHQFSSHDPYVRARNIEGLIEILREHCENEAQNFSDLEARSLFETSASVLDGLSKAFQHYLVRDRVPWEEYEETVIHKNSDPWD